MRVRHGLGGQTSCHCAHVASHASPYMMLTVTTAALTSSCERTRTRGSSKFSRSVDTCVTSEAALTPRRHSLGLGEAKKKGSRPAATPTMTHGETGGEDGSSEATPACMQWRYSSCTK